MPISVLVSSLSGTLQAPVTDQTGLSGLWDYELSFTGERRRGATADVAARDPNDAPALFTAVQEQLGLKLDGGRGPVDVLVIDPYGGVLGRSWLPLSRAGMSRRCTPD